MRCINCGTQLPLTAKVCPNCGTPVTSQQLDSGASYYPPTIPPDPYNPANKPATAYGTTGYDPYSIPNPYTAPNPYSTGQTPPPPPSVLPTTSPPTVSPTPPPQKTRRNNIALIAIIGVLIFLLIVGGLFVYLRNATSQTGNQPGTTPTTTNNTPTTQGVPNPYSPHTGTLIMDDPMQDNSKGFKWDEATLNGTAHCGFTNGAYHFTTGKNESLSCNPEASQLSSLTNFAFEVNLTLIKGIAVGIVFRENQPNATYYIFDIDTLGDYAIFAYDGKNLKSLTTGFNANAAIVKGLNQPNLLAVVAQGNKFSFYANNQYIDTKTDSTYAQGQIGVFVASSTTDTADATASNARVWQMP